jgi:hypothetical protein
VSRPTVAVSVCLAALANASAQAAAEPTLRPQFRPNRLGAPTALTVALTSTGGGEAGQEELPPPLSRVVLHLPAGLRIDMRGAGLCRPARLLAQGADGCPPRSVIGRGHAVVAARPAFQTISENTTLTAFRVPDRRGEPAMAILGQGYTPLEQRSVSTGTLQRDVPPYGLKLTMSIPAIPTLADEPNASILSASLTVGAAGAARGHAPIVIVEPRRCASLGFPFAAELTFADGSSGHARATASCP